MSGRLRRWLSGHSAIVVIALTLTNNALAGNPGYDRPGLGFTPAVLQPGDITWEQGLPDWSEAGGVSWYTADSLLRLGVGGPFEVQLGSSYNRLSMDSHATWGRGDSSLGLKFALPASDGFSWGLLGSLTLTDGAREFRGDDRVVLVGAAFNWQIDPHDALGAYLENDHHGGHDDHLLACNASHALTDSLGAYVELAWSHAAEAGDGSQVGAGLALQATQRVQLDVSVRRRITGDVDAWEAGFGVSVYFGSR